MLAGLVCPIQSSAEALAKSGNYDKLILGVPTTWTEIDDYILRKTVKSVQWHFPIRATKIMFTLQLSNENKTETKH